MIDKIVVNKKTIHLESPKEAIEIIRKMDSFADMALIKPGAELIIQANPERIKKAETAIKDILIACFELLDWNREHPKFESLETIQSLFLNNIGPKLKPEVLILLKRVVVGLWNGQEGAFTAKIDGWLQNKITLQSFRNIIGKDFLGI